MRPLGKTGEEISEIGFGCGNVGGLMRSSLASTTSIRRHSTAMASPSGTWAAC